MNEEAREVCRECHAGATQARGMDLAWRCMKHGVVRLTDYEATRARTFSAEDVERAMLALHRFRGGNDVTWAHMWGSARTKLRGEVCATLAAIGTVEEAQ